MKRWLLTSVVVVAVAASLAAAQGPAAGREGNPPRINWNARLFGPTERFANFDQQQHEPVKLFDNLYDVGLVSITPYLVTTSAGLVLFDASWAETVDMVLNNVRKVGFDPANIKYVFITHSRVDHFGGAARIKQIAPGARVGMSLQDWEEAERQMSTGVKGQQNSAALPLTRDLVIADGQTITLGDTTFKFYVLPGTTPGSIGIEYPVRDRGKTYRALSTGGVAMYGDPRFAAAYVASIERLKAAGPWDVIMPNHPFMVLPHDLAEIEQSLKTRGDGPHPAVVTPAAANALFDRALTLAHEKMAMEQKASQ